MNGGLLTKMYFLAGRAARISKNGALAAARGPARVAAWTNQRVVLLNPFNWRKKARSKARRSVWGDGVPREVTRAEVSAAAFADARDSLILSRAVEEMAHQDEAVRTRAVRALGGIRHELSVRALSARLARDPSAEVRRGCVKALTAHGMEGLPAVERALSDRSARVRLAAVQGVYRLKGIESASSLIRMLSDEHEDVRRRAAACVGWLGEERLAAELLPLLDDESAFVRRIALGSLGNLKSSRAVGEIIELLDDPEESIQEKALDVLQIITGKQMAETLPENEMERELLLWRWRAWYDEDFSPPEKGDRPMGKRKTNREKLSRARDETDNSEADDPAGSVPAPAAPTAEFDGGKRSKMNETIRVLERMNKQLLVRVKELEMRQVGGTEQGKNYELSEEGKSVIAAVEDLHGEVEAACDLKEAFEADLAATQKKLSKEKTVRAHLEARVGLLEPKAAFVDELRQDISFVEEEQNKTFRRLRDITSELERVAKERDSLEEQKATRETRIKELENERIELEVQVMRLKERLAEMVSFFSMKRASSS